MLPGVTTPEDLQITTSIASPAFPPPSGVPPFMRGWDDERGPSPADIMAEVRGLREYIESLANYCPWLPSDLRRLPEQVTVMAHQQQTHAVGRRMQIVTQESFDIMPVTLDEAFAAPPEDETAWDPLLDASTQCNTQTIEAVLARMPARGQPRPARNRYTLMMEGTG